MESNCSVTKSLQEKAGLKHFELIKFLTCIFGFCDFFFHFKNSKFSFYVGSFFII